MPPRRKRVAKSTKSTARDREPAPKRRRRVCEPSSDEADSVETSSTPGAGMKLEDHVSEQVAY